MLAIFSLLMFSAAACCGIGAMALRDHRAVLAARARLLKRVSELFGAAVPEIAPDGFPRLVGRTPDGRQVAVELVADTMVTRRLPQLWLIVTVTKIPARLQGSIGALARPTGAEFYALTHELADRRDPPAGLDAAMLVRSTGRFTAAQLAAAENAFRRIMSDPGVKEVVASPHGFRIVRQAAQGDRAAHMVFRQVRFPLEAVDPELVRRSLQDAETLAEALCQPPLQETRLSA